MGKKENAIERPVCAYAKKAGFEVRKLKFIQHDGAPDRLFFGYGELFFMEFKSPDGELSPAQVREIKKMRVHKIKVFVVDTIMEGELIIDGARLTSKEKGWTPDAT